MAIEVSRSPPCCRMPGSLESKFDSCAQSISSQWLVKLSGLGSGCVTSCRPQILLILAGPWGGRFCPRGCWAGQGQEQRGRPRL